MPSFAVALPPPSARRLRPTRVHVAVVIAVIVGFYVLLAFSRTMAQLNEATQRAAAVRADNADLTSRLAEAQTESALLQSDAYLRFEARGFGMGRPGERAFGLVPGARAPEPMVPLGGSVAAQIQPTPLDNWLNLLFGD
jgi:cell division protein FtsB